MSTHPTYEVMICDALVSLAERKGSSNVAIFKFIKDKYKFDEETLKPQLKLALKRLSDQNKLVKVSLNRYRLSLGERKSLRATNAGAKSKVALKKKVRKVTKSPTKTGEAVKVKKIAPEVAKKSPKKDTKKEKITKLKKTSATAKPKVKKVGEGKAAKRTLKTKTMEASKTKSKASVKARSEKAATKGKAASAAIKTARRSRASSATATTTDASTVEK